VTHTGGVVRQGGTRPFGTVPWFAFVRFHQHPSASSNKLAQVHKGENMLSILGTLLVGLVVGFIARAIKPGDDKLG